MAAGTPAAGSPAALRPWRSTAARADRGSPRGALRRVLALPLVLGLTVLLPAFVALRPGAGLRDQAYWLQLVLTVYAGARLSAMILGRHRKLLQGTFWLFVYMAMGIAPLAQTVVGKYPVPVAGSRSDLALAVGLVLVACAVFDAGALLVRPGVRPTARTVFRPAVVARRRVALLVALAFAGSGLFVAKLGGLGVFFSSRMEISEAVGNSGVAGAGSQAGTAMLRGFGTVPALLALMVVTRWLITSPAARRRPLPWLTLVALAGLNGIVNNPISNPRYWFLTVLLALLFTVFPQSPAMYRAALTLGVAAAVLIFPFADRFRYDSANTPAAAQTSSVLDPLVLKDYDQMAMFANTLTYADAGNGHTYGRQLAGSVLFFVPRSVWTAKPRDTGVMVSEWMAAANTNRSSPLWAELWLDFGPVGMVAGFGLIGWTAARVDRRYAHGVLRAGPAGVLTLAVPLVAGYSFILLRGPLLQASGRIAIGVVCLALITTLRPERWRQLR
ncbi:hypothetical protein [Streptomyces tropicalis]|uniref:Oligosaccharide repeat unit polymerase n=1 Tax=Streptomyces tropicalis TaxID=3034234 RepID=A0ABT6ADG0_9ACTN|nr:hypothetical protein [Streptomyces tropicalis]MDF3302698.1 hypothetical protein [Streptomyces tropicalis]